MLSKTFTTSYLCLITKLFKVAKLFNIYGMPHLRTCCIDIETNRNVRYSFLTFGIGIKVASQLMILLKSHYFKHISPSTTMT